MSDTSTGRARRGADWFRRFWYGVRGDLDAVWNDYLKSDPRCANVNMVVDLVFGHGLRHRVASTVLDVTWTDPLNSASSTTFQVVAGMIEEPAVTFSYTLGSGASISRSLAFQIVLPDLKPWTVLRQHGRMLAGMAEVSLLGAGMDWSSRLVVMRGDMTGGVTFGVEREAVALTITDPKLTADIGITDVVTDTVRFPDLPDNSVGRRFPLALNSPSRVPLLRLTATAPPTFMVTYGHGSTVTAAFVDGTLYLSGSGAHPWTVQYLYDDLGTPYTALVFGGGSGTWEDNTEVHANITPVDDAQSRDLIQTCQYLINQWSLLGPSGVNTAACGRAQSSLPTREAPGIYINASGEQDATGALSYIEQSLGGSYPFLSWAWQINGYGPVVTNRSGIADYKLTVGQGLIFKRATPWQEVATGTIINWMTLRYYFNPMTDTYERVLERNPTNSPICDLSERQVGPRVGTPLESVILKTDGEATAIADWLVRHITTPAYRVQHPCSAELALRLRLGQRIDLTDPDIEGSDTTPVRATVLAITYSKGGCSVDLLLWPMWTAFAASSNAPVVANP